MSEVRTRLAQWCRGRQMGTELVDRSRSVDEVLDRALAECRRRLEKPGSDPAELVARLDGMLRLACQAREIQRSETASDASRTETVRQDLDRAIDKVAHAPGDRGRGDAEVLGELFSDVSRLCHKINNPLTSIMGRAQMLQMKTRPGADPAVGKSVTVIEESARRVAALVQELANLILQGRKEFVDGYDSSNGSR